jgi:Na+-driven multidrug efflux pump
MGIRGAALATVISRYVELAVVAVWTHRNPKKNPFIPGALRSFHIPGALLEKIAVKSLPLMFNECMWSLSMTIINQSYSTCGLDVVPAMNIFTTLKQLTGVAYLAMGNAVGIIMGQTLGAGKSPEEARDVNRKLMTLAAGCGVVFAIVSICCADLFPMLYKTSDDIRLMAAQLIRIFALFMPLYAYNHSVYFTLRSGGLILTTTLYDSISIWVFCVPPVFLLSRLTDIGIIPLFLVGHAIDVIKTVLGVYLLRKGNWIRNLVRK